MSTLYSKMANNTATLRNQRTFQLAVWIAWLTCVSLSLAETFPPCELEGQCKADFGAVGPAEGNAADGQSQSTTPFPSGNEAIPITGKRLQELLSALNNMTGDNSSLVTLFYLADCPNSRAMKPVYECLPAFFTAQVPFVSVSHSEMSLMSLMTHGIHALPVLQVNARGRKYRYSGKHWLAPMLTFVAKALGVEPLASVDVAMLCSNQSQPQAGDRSNSSSSGSTAGTLGHSTCSAAEAGSSEEQQLSVCGGWSCPRWDGEATADELTATQHRPMFFAAVVFLALRIIWWAWSRLKRVAARPPGLRAAAAAGGGAVPAAAGVASSEVACAEAATQQPATEDDAMLQHIPAHAEQGDGGSKGDAS